MLELSSLSIIRNSSVGIVNRLMVGPKNRMSFPDRRTVFFFPQHLKLL